MSRFWRDDALCGLGTSRLWDPPAGQEIQSGAFAERHLRANRICADCPVQAECLGDAVAAEADGIFAGVLLEGGRPTTPRPVGRPKAGAA